MGDALERYLARIGWGAPAPDRLDRETITALAAAHAARVPFENLRLHPDGALVLDRDLIMRRILDDEQGGLCYELNGAFAWLLERLGARVEYLGASVEIVEHGEPPRIGFPLSHMALRVTTDDETLLVDVGFGGTVIVRDAAADGERITVEDGRTYIVDGEARGFDDFRDAAHWHSTDPGSRFQQAVVCSVVREGTVVTLFGRPGEQPDAPPQWGFVEGGERRPVSRDEAQTLLHERFGMRRTLPVEVKRHAADG